MPKNNKINYHYHQRRQPEKGRFPEPMPKDVAASETFSHMLEAIEKRMTSLEQLLTLVLGSRELNEQELERLEHATQGYVEANGKVIEAMNAWATRKANEYHARFPGFPSMEQILQEHQEWMDGLR